MTPVLAVNDIEVFTLWWITVCVLFVVIIVATGLLQNIVVVLRNIDENVAKIWTVGKRIANNTVELWMLGRVNSLVGDILSGAGRINEVAGAIADHAQVCRHCPACANPNPGRGGAPAPSPFGSPFGSGPAPMPFGGPPPSPVE